ncbi:MAG: hypothetical protein LBG75_00575 [Candidatus Nomurabacteria bacterium]|jgi:cytoskeletal protein RodZ|nr:hypothetical protein [Candidatus Nomurabacteria bacterium]
MRIQKKHKRTKRTLLVTLLVVLVAAGSVGAVAIIDKNSNKQSSSSEETSSKSKDQSKEKGSTKNADSEDPSFKEKAEEAAKDGSSSQPEGATLDVAITGKNVSGGKLYISVMIGAVTNSGECKVTLTKGSAVVTKTSGINAMPQSSSCQGFEVPVSELSSGTWQIGLVVTTGNRTGQAQTEVSI